MLLSSKRECLECELILRNLTQVVFEVFADRFLSIQVFWCALSRLSPQVIFGTEYHFHLFCSFAFTSQEIFPVVDIQKNARIQYLWVEKIFCYWLLLTLTFITPVKESVVKEDRWNPKLWVDF